MIFLDLIYGLQKERGRYEKRELENLVALGASHDYDTRKHG